MTRNGIIITVVLSISLLATVPAGIARAGITAGGPATAPAEALPGVELAETVATATGLAITPLFGVSAVGAWHYYRAEPEVRERLPWYASPWFWGPGCLVALLLVFKDPLLGLVPGAKKPLDAVDVVENKVSGLLATPVVIPMFFSAFAGLDTAGRIGAVTEGLAVRRAGIGGMLETAWDLPRAVPLAIAGVMVLAAFFCVWLVFHAINVLILLSPFGVLDTLLRSVKLAVLAVLAGSALLHPYLGLVVALLIVAASIPLAGWAWRLMVFGGVVATDFIFRRHRKVAANAVGVPAFTVGRLEGARARTYGTLSLSGGGLRFAYRPRPLWRRRTVELPAGSYRVGRGLLCPVVQRRDEDGRVETLLRLPPRFRTHEEWVAERLVLEGVEVLPLRRGLRAVMAWVRETAGRGEETARAAAAALRERTTS